jgi:hypothetical protein
MRRPLAPPRGEEEAGEARRAHWIWPMLEIGDRVHPHRKGKEKKRKRGSIQPSIRTRDRSIDRSITMWAEKQKALWHHMRRKNCARGEQLAGGSKIEDLDRLSTVARV